MNAHVAVYVSDEKVFQTLQEAAQETSFILHQSPVLKDYLNQSFVICDAETYLGKLAEFENIQKNFLYVISAGTDEENMKLIESHGLHHLVGLNDGIYGPEIFCHLRKMSEKKIWGVQSHLEKGAEVKVISLSDSKFTNEMIQEALGHFDFKDYFSSPIEYIQVMANELISNSLYKGPNKKRQVQGLESVDRKSPVFLKGSDLVQVNLGMDSKGVALSVQDSFGGLSYELLIASLKRSFEEKTVMDKKDGAGLGLYLTFLHSNQFIINYRKDFRTEVICIIEKNKRYKNYKQRIRSFHFFQEVPSEKTNH
jgi:sigma-B regulation protein RsbU (phosphoserine phosphatase)